MTEDDVRRIAKEMIKDEMLVSIKGIRVLLELNLKVSSLLLAGVSNMENFSTSRRQVVELLENVKGAMKQKPEQDKDDR
jgi:hypothetical protein